MITYFTGTTDEHEQYEGRGSLTEFRLEMITPYPIPHEATTWLPEPNPTS